MEMFCLVVSISILSVFILKYVVRFFLFLVVSLWEGRKIKSKNNITNVNHNVNSMSLKRKILIAIYDGIYRIVDRRLSKITFMPYKIFLYKHILKMKIGKKVVIHYGTRIYKGRGVTIGDGTIIGENVTLDGRGGLYIGENVNFSSYAQVFTAQHNPNDSLFVGVSKEVIIESRSWISNSAIVLPGVHIKEGTVIAAGSIVTKDTDSFGFYAGIPSKKIKERNKDINYEFDGLTGIIA